MGRNHFNRSQRIGFLAADPHIPMCQIHQKVLNFLRNAFPWDQNRDSRWIGRQRLRADMAGRFGERDTLGFVL